MKVFTSIFFGFGYGATAFERCHKTRRLSQLNTASFSLIGQGYCQNDSGEYYSAIVSSPLSSTNSDSYCHDWCTQVPHSNLVGVEVYRSRLEDIHCACIYSDGIPNDVDLIDYSPNADYSIKDGGAVGAVIKSNDDLSAVCYGINTIKFSMIGQGYCQNNSGEYYSAVVSSPLSSTNSDSYCQEWCSQVPHSNLVGVEVYRFRLEDVYCACLYSDGIANDVDLIDYSPNADHSITDGWAVGAVLTSNEDLGVVCYGKSSQSVTSANRVRVESTTGNQLSFFEFQVQTSGGNVALQGSASQSSTYKNESKYAASQAIDGINTTFSHTHDLNPFWEVELDATYSVENVTILNRYCQNEGCLCRLTNATLTLYQGDNLVVTRTIGNTCGELVVTQSFKALSPSSSPSNAPTHRPTSAPTLADCDDPETCKRHLQDIINDVSVQVGTTAELNDPNSAQSRASTWILGQCDDTPPINPCNTTLLDVSEQRYALAVMYFSLGGDSWNAGSNPGQDPDAPAGQWMSLSDHCDWGAEISNGYSYNQLVCDEFGNVLNLNLQLNNLVGPIPPEIGILKFMTSYISHTNSINSSIPTTLGLITPLQTFDVESNTMVGDLFQLEYSGPDGLKEIIDFKASFNNFTGSIPTGIGLWTKLQNLWFADNEITGTLPSEIGNCVDMETFLFSSNGLNGTLPTQLGNIDRLTWIDMEDNQMSGTIPEEFYSNLKLEQVIMKNNRLQGTLSEVVGDLTMLVRFWVSLNQLSGTIPATVGNCINLEELELQNNNFGGRIPSEFGSLEELVSLNVEQNDLTGPIPSQLFSYQLSSLKVLYLNSNKLTGTIPDTYGQLPRIKVLWLDDNQLSGTLPIIAEGELLFLEELLINNNDLIGEVDDSLCLIRDDVMPGGNLGVFYADCQPSEGGGPPQILCNCCTACFV